MSTYRTDPPDPIDLDHLNAVTMNDRKLEEEVLGLFGKRASRSLIAIEQAKDTAELSSAAHLLVGAARAIGANALAEIAEEIEKAEGLSSEAMDGLSNAASDVVAFLETRLSQLR